jgi:peptide methionine sulfoxide reductase msrA/msrB
MNNDKNVRKTYFASGCFWGTEYWFMKAEGVKATAAGFTGTTGHLECVEVEYDAEETNYGNLVKLFFETHDFTQTNGQGPDIGSQYLSCLFYANEKEKKIAEDYISRLEEKGYKVATRLEPLSTFWIAEDYHQQYYEHKGTQPYCHSYRKIF